MINKWIGIGNLTKDPEAKTTHLNKSVVSFGIAINNKFIDGQGQAQEDTTFIDCTAFGKVADVIAQYCQKGKKVAVEGRLKLDRWTDQSSGAQRQKLGVVVEKLEMLDSGQSKAPGHHGHYEQQQQQQEQPRMGSTDEDIPF